MENSEWLTPRTAHDPSLAWNLQQFAHHADSGEHAHVDAAWPALLASVRGDAWLELYVRHIRLDSLLLQRRDARRGLPEAKELLLLSGTDAARECPLAVVAVADICSAFSAADGPGWADERLRLTEGALGRTDASSLGYAELCREHASALVDAGRYEDALAFEGTPVWPRVDALVALERFEEALKLALDSETEDALTRRVQASRCLVAADRLDDADKTLPSFAEVEASPALWPVYGRARVNLVRKRGQGWSREVRNPLAAMANVLDERGNARNAFNLWFGIAALDVGFNMLVEGEAAAGRCTELAGDLESSEGARGQLTQVATALGAVPWPEVPDDRTEAEAMAAEGLDMTRAVLLARKFPDWWQVVSGVANTWRASVHPEQAIAVLRAAVDAGLEPALYALANVYTDEGDPDSLEKLLQGEGVSDSARAFFTSVVAQLRGDAQGAIDALAGRDDDPQLVERRMELLYNQKDWPALLSSAKGFIASGAEAGSVDWKLLVAAAFEQDHAAARASAARLEMELSTPEGPITEAWGPVLLAEGDGRLFGLRTGPVTAVVLQITGPSNVERHGDEVVFHAAPLNADDEGEMKVFPVIGLRRPGGFRGFSFDARHPGDSALREFTTTLHEAGFPSWVSSNEAYTLDAPEGDSVRGLYLRVAVPDGGSLTELAACLKSIDWGLAWLELAEAIGDAAEVERQKQIIEAWEL
jgi:hypothetical protein